jgi:hypothetical protein
MKQMGASCRFLLAIAALGFVAAALAREVPGGGTINGELVPRHQQPLPFGAATGTKRRAHSGYPPGSGQDLVKEDGVEDSQYRNSKPDVPSGEIENSVVYSRNPPSYPGYGNAIGDVMLRASTPPAPTSDPNIHDNAPPSHHHA